MSDMSGARRAMVDSQLRPEAVTDRGVLAAMGSVERERFVPEGARALAYSDRSLPIAAGRTMMAPAALGRLLSELAPAAGDRALVIGSGGGYSAAVLTAIGLTVTALESDQALASAADAAGVATHVGDLTCGWAADAPYKLILIDGAVEEIPATLTRQLAPGGRLGGGLVDRGVTRLVVGRVSNGSLGITTLADTDVAVLPGFARPQAFTF